ncbi:MAG TPA: glycolate oxidase subunit GlcE [Burkholderiaceae bacterium]|nr:glycolate oxidase subunit GlcE [Burkholderiaceae bacterium]
MNELLTQFADRVRAAAAARTPLAIRAGGTKDFYGNAPRGEPFDPRACAGIVAYEPTELVITARCGTPLAELEAALDERGQMLAFEPPHFGAGATVGGCIAAGLSGPRRAAYGAASGGVRDFVLGAKLLDGQGRVLSFGGTVMKNVAGFDVARALAGSLGILGVILEASIKVLPKPAAEATRRFEMDEATALDRTNVWAGQPLPVSATAWCAGVLHVRLSGAAAAVRAAGEKLGGEAVDAECAAAFWRGIREHTDAFFAVNAPLWRLALPSTAAPLAFGAQLIEWNGALRWLRSDTPAREVRARATQLGGHATLFRGGDRAHGVFTPLAPPVAAIHQRLKKEFDPAGIFNPGRMYEGL